MKNYKIGLFAFCVLMIFFITQKTNASFYDSRPFNNDYSFTTDQIDSTIVKSDSSKIRYQVKKTVGNNFDELSKASTIDLSTPTNIVVDVKYDPNNLNYYFTSRVGDVEISTPFSMSFDDYYDKTLKQSMKDYFKKKNSRKSDEENAKDDFVLKNIKVNVSPIDKIFGPGGVKVNASGFVEATMGIQHTSIQNPMLSANRRSKTMFDFDENIQMNVNATVGNTINFDMNYDTEAMFDFDTKRINLTYDAALAGDEDGVLRKISAGNVTMATTNSLIKGSTALFGITSELQFGRLKINSIISQQETQTYSTSTDGGVQKNLFEFKADNYDENRHFYLSQYFLGNYDKAMSKIPLVQSQVLITNLEVWVTNTQGNTENTRNVIAFADIAEPITINNPKWVSNSSQPYPYNEGNTLYKTFTAITGARDINQISQIMDAQNLANGQDYEKIESARKLEASEYYYNPQIGFLSLTSAIRAEEVLGVSFTYTYRGQTYKVGELSSDISSPYNAAEPQRTGSLFVKLLKPTSLSPISYSWPLMMKNVYSLGATNIQETDFSLQVKLKVDSLGSTINYFPEGKMKNKLLIRVLGLDRLNKQQQARPDGLFDFVDGYTINASTGRVYFPHVEPFGKGLKDSIGDSSLDDKYLFQDLYSTTKTQAQQNTEQNKYYLSGYYRGSNAANEISLNAFNIPKGSVVVMANSVTLVENVDYIIDYSAGKVIIINQDLLDSNATIDVSYEGLSYTTERKTLMGLNLSYEFNKNFNIGGTLLRYTEKPLISNLAYGQDAVSNTIWGLNMSYTRQSMWLTNLINKIPYIDATAPSSINVNAEFAQLVPGHYVNSNTGAYAYIDDFENARVGYDIKDPYAWSLAATPVAAPLDNGGVRFPNATESNNIKYGMDRAMFAWYTIDPLFTRRNSALRPSHIDNDQLSDHFVREILMSEIYENRDVSYNMSSVIYPLNLSLYPEERGPYNLDTQNITAENKLLQPEKRWGGMTRKLSVTDFESANIEYIEFWLMDPFVNNNNSQYTPNQGGKLVFNLGNISEDILKDGKKFYENGLPLDGNLEDVEETVWGRVPKKQAMVYAFDNQNRDAIRIQDVGLNGLSVADELEFPTYKTYLDQLRTKLSASVQQEMLSDPMSPFNSPAKDKYRYYRGREYDNQQATILERYKFYNNTEGNSLPEKDTDENFSTASKTTPDVEDINQDFTLNEQESYFEYEVSLDPDKMEIGESYIIDKKEVSNGIPLRNGKKNDVIWYQFRIPLKSEDKKKVGNISGFNSMRFMRVYLTEFKQDTHLRFATLELVRGDWRIYDKPLSAANIPNNGSLTVSSINIEQDFKRSPVNYVLPPGVTRIPDANQAQLTQENEQSLMMTFSNVEPKELKAIYKSTSYDLRNYKRLQMFTHLENLINSNEIKDNEVSIFMRLGSDYKENYYEYEIPLTVTPPKRYDKNENEKVWPKNNMFDIRLELLKNIKLNRNKVMRTSSQVSFSTPYYEYDPANQVNKVTVLGNPSLSDVDVIMIGLKNNGKESKSGIIWVDELRLSDFDEEGGWAMQAAVNLNLSDIGQFVFSGRKETVGFGSVEQSLLQRRLDDYNMYNVATSIDIGRLLPKQVKLTLPFSMSYSKETITPKYDPFDKDVTIKESLNLMDTKQERDSIKSLAREMQRIRSFSFNNVRFNQTSNKPMPYDLSNFTFSYVNNYAELNSPELVYDKSLYYQFILNYSYSPNLPMWEPFKNIKGTKGANKFLKGLGFNFLPNNLSFNSVITRNYTETLTRDIEAYRNKSDEKNNILSWSQSFFWDRDYNLNWNLTKNLKFNFQSGMKAEIEEPYLQVNKKANPTAYELWKDAVWRSIRSLGDPYSYNHSAGLTYQVPLNNIPVLDFIKSTTFSYKTTYNWDRGVTVDSIFLGNSIQNSQTIDIASTVSLTSLYNKSKYLKQVNDRFDGKAKKNVKKETPKPRQFKQTVMLKTDTGVIVKHNLKSKDIELNFPKGRKLSYKKIDENSIFIKTKDSISVPINISTKIPKEKNSFVEELRDHTVRALMSLQSVNVLYSTRNETYLPSFIPGSSDFLGQRSSDFGQAPGLGFAFGFDGGRDYINKSLQNNWLQINDANISPAIYNTTRKFNFQTKLQPVKGLIIDLVAGREKTERSEFQFMYDDMPTVHGGSFSMTTISLASSFKIGKSGTNYYSESFQKFLNNRDVISQRISNQYNQILYPSSGFMKNYPGLIGTPYDTSVSPVNQASADVLIPAFLSAYTGKDVQKVGLNPFPSLSSILPNWSVSYEVLNLFSGLKNQFRSLQLLHGYQSNYMVTGYNSFTDWVGTSSDFGFVPDIVTGRPVPSSPYNISSVVLTESFNPLFGVNSALNNGFLLNILYKRDRTVNLNISSYQIIETLSRDVVLGTGYRWVNFNRVLGLNVGEKERRGRRNQTENRTANSFNNDLIMKLDLSSKMNQILIRKIMDNYTQATSGNTVFTLMLSAEYNVSQEMTLKAFYDWIINKPLISATSYPISTTNFGITVRYNLTK